MPVAQWTSPGAPALAGRTMVVTGASSGLGRETAAALARGGARVVLAVRDTAKGARAAAQMDGETEVRPLDLADLASVRRFAEAWTEPLDVLVNNAGVMAVPRGRTADGFETQIGVNHLGHFALTLLLLPHIRDRVVTVTSELSRRGRIDLEDLNAERHRYRPWRAYRQSKLANQLFTFELQRRLVLRGSAVRALSAHPGVAATPLRHTGGRLRDLALLPLFLLAQDAARGALPTLFAATEELAGGSLVGPDDRMGTRYSPRATRLRPAAADPDVARRLWELSAELTGVGPEI